MGVKVKLEVVQKERSPPTPENSAIVRKVRRAVKEVVGIETKLVGIGGGTCAAHFRKRGFQVAVWHTVEGKAHSVNEYMKIDNMVQDAKVFAHLFGQQ